MRNCWLYVALGLLGSVQGSAIDFVRDENGIPIMPAWCTQALASSGREQKTSAAAGTVTEKQQRLLQRIEEDLNSHRFFTFTERPIYDLFARFLEETRHERTVRIVLEESWRDLDASEILIEVFEHLGEPTENIDYLDPVGSLISVIQDSRVILLIELNDEYAPVQLYPLADALHRLREETPNTLFLYYSPSDNGTLTSSEEQ